MEKFIICDHTENSGKPYISENTSNTGDPESAKFYNSLVAAESAIIENGWHKWAYVESFNL